MHLEPIDRPDLPTRTNADLTPGDVAGRSRCRRARRDFILGGLVASVLVLAACAEGTQRDAERGREDDAQRDSIVKELQATETWSRINGTPPPTPDAED